MPKKGKKQGNGGQQQGVAKQPTPAQIQQEAAATATAAATASTPTKPDGANSDASTAAALSPVAALTADPASTETTQSSTSTTSPSKPAAIATEEPASEDATGAGDSPVLVENDAPDKAQVAARLDRKLANRPAHESLKSQGIVKEGGRFAAEKSRLEKELSKDNLARALDSRAAPEELKKAGLLADHDRVAPALQGPAKQLQKNLIASQLNKELHRRRGSEDLTGAGVLRAADVAPALRSAKIALEHAITRDHVGHLLEQRPDLEQVRSIVAPQSHVAPRLQGIQRQLEHNMTTNKVGHLLEQRSDASDLVKAGVLPKEVLPTGEQGQPTIAPSLAGVQRNLQHNLAKSNLFHALANRPELEELADRGIYRQPESPLKQAQPPRSRPSPPTEPRPPPQSQLTSSPTAAPSAVSSVASRQRAFELTRILLSFVAELSTVGRITLAVKGAMKDAIVDQESGVLQAAEEFRQTGDALLFERRLTTFVQQQQRR